MTPLNTKQKQKRVKKPLKITRKEWHKRGSIVSAKKACKEAGIDYDAYMRA